MPTEAPPRAAEPTSPGPTSPPAVTAASIIGSGLRTMFRRPLLKLILLNLLVVVVSHSLRGDDAAVVAGWLLLTAVGLYVQIAATLAAASTDPGPSADRWIKSAFARRCFWRYLGATFLQLVLVFLGFVGLVVGAFVVGAIVAVAPTAAILERRKPIEALQRSAELTRPARRAVGTVFGLLVIVPAVATQLAILRGAGPDGDPLQWWAINLAGAFLAFLATVAFARAFVALGGNQTSSPDPR